LPIELGRNVLGWHRFVPSPEVYVISSGNP
jgi:hypothetical protein